MTSEVVIVTGPGPKLVWRERRSHSYAADIHTLVRRCQGLESEVMRPGSYLGRQVQGVGLLVDIPEGFAAEATEQEILAYRAAWLN